jgi:large subunit ribosomal protein L2
MLKVKKIKNRGKRVVSYIWGANVDRSSRPYKPLTRIWKKKSGRMRSGKISVRHRGGGSRRRYRLIEFKRNKGDFKVERIEKDPNRSNFIALVSDKKGSKFYMPAIIGMKVGDTFQIGDKVSIKKGNRTCLSRILAGSFVSNVELFPGSKGQLARAAGTYAVVMGQENGMSQLKMPSGEIRQVNEKCYATIGQSSNPENNMVRIGKAGRTRLLGIRPKVRGKAMNPVDHPHGGGEGNESIGMKHPKNVWGKIALGVKTRKKKKKSNRYIIRRRVHKRK